MKAAYVSPAVAYLAHQDTTLNGEVLVSGDKMFKRLALVETKGLQFDRPTTPEDIRDNLEQLMDMTDADLMTINLWGE